MTKQEVVERESEIRATGEPLLWVRAKRQIVVLGFVRFMGETFQLPERFALGLVGAGEVEQVVDFTLPLNWLQQAPGPFEPFDLPGDFAVQGSREGGTANRGGEPGDLQTRQLAAAQVATELQPQTVNTDPMVREPLPDAGTFRGAHPPRQHPHHSQFHFPRRAEPRN